MGSGFDGDTYEGRQFFGLYSGTVIDNVDPEKKGRVKVEMELLDESPWCDPKSGGFKNFGKMQSSPIGANVFIQFVNGRIENPVYEWGPHSDGDQFDEYESEEMTVIGDGDYRIVIDKRSENSTFGLYAIKNIDGVEETVASIELSAETNSMRIFAETAITIVSNTIIDVDAPGDIQLKGRKIASKTSGI